MSLFMKTFKRWLFLFSQILSVWLIGNRTSCRPILSVIRYGRPIFLISRMITDRIGLHSVLLGVDHLIFDGGFVGFLGC